MFKDFGKRLQRDIKRKVDFRIQREDLLELKVLMISVVDNKKMNTILFTRQKRLKSMLSVINDNTLPCGMVEAF
jgi:hypothetical protein